MADESIPPGKVNAAPVIERELREESRRPVNFLLRVLSAAVLIAAFAFSVLSWPFGLERLGSVLFLQLHRTLTLAFWVMVPLMTADCVSREKREGTLGLLLLTPLTISDVIAGKVAIHALRAFTLFLAAVPLIGLPLVLGGVTGPRVLLAVTEQANAVVLAIAAGILSSAHGGTTIQAMVRAEIYALGLMFLSRIWLLPLVFGRNIGWPSSVLVTVISTVCSFAVVAFLVRRAINHLRATWQEDLPDEQPKWVEAFSSSDFWRSFFHWDKRKVLERNPIEWLQEYSWTARLTKWGWFFAGLLGGFIILNARRGSSYHVVVTAGLALGFAFSAAGSFRRERDSGLLELLLVTPLSASKLIHGRAWGLFCHYFPALMAICVAWLGQTQLNPANYWALSLGLWFPNPFAFLAMLFLGMLLSLGRLNFFFTWLLTWLLGYVIPAVACHLSSTSTGGMGLQNLVFTVLVQLILATACWLMVHQRVRSRAFVVNRSDKAL